MAALQKSLKALSGLALVQPSKQMQAKRGRFAILEQPPSNCLPAGAPIDRNRQQKDDIYCQFKPGRAGRPSSTAQAPHTTTLAALQQPRPTRSLLHSSGASDSDIRGRQLRTPPVRVTQHPPTGVYSSNEAPQSKALRTTRENGALHSRLQQTSRSGPVISNPPMLPQEHQPATAQEALMDSLKSTTSPIWTDCNAQGGVNKPPEQFERTLMQEPAGTAGRQAGRADAVCKTAPSAPAASQQQGDPPREASELAISPLLEPTPYIVEEPDSPAQEPVVRSWGVAAEQQKSMPSCLITETTVTRSDMEGHHGSCQFSLLEVGQSCHIAC